MPSGRASRGDVSRDGGSGEAAGAGGGGGGCLPPRGVRGVCGLGVRVQGSAFSVQGLEFEVWGWGFRIYDLGLGPGIL